MITGRKFHRKTAGKLESAYFCPSPDFLRYKVTLLDSKQQNTSRLAGVFRQRDWRVLLCRNISLQTGFTGLSSSSREKLQ